MPQSREFSVQRRKLLNEIQRLAEVRYYVPQGAEKTTREGVAAWQKLQACLRELAELNKERNLQQAREVEAP